jgi:hypothetical protein
VEGGDTVLVSANLKGIAEAGKPAEPAAIDNKQTNNEENGEE